MVLAGREVMFRKATLGQVLMLQRMYVRAAKASEDLQGDQERIDMMGSAMVKVLDFIDTLIIDPDDRQFVEDGMYAGTIDYKDLVGALGGQKADPSPADDAAPVRKPSATKRAASKKVAKSVASRARTQR